MVAFVQVDRPGLSSFALSFIFPRKKYQQRKFQTFSSHAALFSVFSKCQTSTMSANFLSGVESKKLEFLVSLAMGSDKIDNVLAKETKEMNKGLLRRLMSPCAASRLPEPRASTSSGKVLLALTRPSRITCRPSRWLPSAGRVVTEELRSCCFLPAPPALFPTALQMAILLRGFSLPPLAHLQRSPPTRCDQGPCPLVGGRLRATSPSRHLPRQLLRAVQGSRHSLPETLRPHSCSCVITALALSCLLLLHLHLPPLPNPASPRGPGEGEEALDQ
ncbi:uncharacterized protein LOC111558237 [Felis catus]|uniref:uncharacterized protein LOC111558237 n=1 Tax=Felis catus TaxID=9685 RepID=UPI001D19CF2F|nr:uncharacterized protein LOC111558237 [Felis catus]XP_044903654.1 uncharacterized protein LOC111558237 [Felis catus]XP_044903655.1 uncharacterized protein LOC111558237 [Felis catus]